MNILILETPPDANLYTYNSTINLHIFIVDKLICNNRFIKKLTALGHI
jgi:hypothetical protein